MHQNERRLWWGYYRPYMRAIVLFVGCTLGVCSFLFGIDRRQQREWGGAALQQGEATCVQAQLYVPKSGVGFRTVYRIDEVERIAQEHDGCVIGQQYALHYQIGRTGLLRVLDRRLL